MKFEFHHRPPLLSWLLSPVKRIPKNLPQAIIRLIAQNTDEKKQIGGMELELRLYSGAQLIVWEEIQTDSPFDVDRKFYEGEYKPPALISTALIEARKIVENRKGHWSKAAVLDLLSTLEVQPEAELLKGKT